MSAATEHLSAKTVHATAIVLAGRGALIRGPSGSGKSDLALRCLGLAPSGLITGQARLIADDRVVISREGRHILLSAPQSLAGKLEIRGLGIVSVAAAASGRLVLVVDLVANGEHIERHPDPSTMEIEGESVALVRLHPFEASAPVKLLFALQAMEGPR